MALLQITAENVFSLLDPKMCGYNRIRSVPRPCVTDLIRFWSQISPQKNRWQPKLIGTPHLCHRSNSIPSIESGHRSGSVWKNPTEQMAHKIVRISNIAHTFLNLLFFQFYNCWNQWEIWFVILESEKHCILCYHCFDLPWQKQISALCHDLLVFLQPEY